MLKKDTGYILRHIRLRDHSKIIYLFSKDNGKYGFVVPNAYKLEISPTLELLNKVRISVYSKEDRLATLKEIDSLHSDYEMDDFLNQKLVLYISSLISSVIPQEGKSIEIYSLLEKIVPVLKRRKVTGKEADRICQVVIRQLAVELGVMENELKRTGDMHKVLEKNLNRKLWRPEALEG